ncbi:MAG: TAXI family TRAP transporter solute-binding subunit [Candidatus Rifleibacteriota bacterium]
MKKSFSSAILLLTFSFLVLNQLHGQEYRLNLIKRFYSIGTASINGTYFPIGNSIARTLSANLKNLVAIAEPTEGSVANVEYLRKGQIDLSLMQSDIAWQAARGIGPFSENPFKELKVLSSLYSEVIQIVVKSSSNIKTLSDLKGCKISVGSKESGSAVNAVQVLTAAGLQPSDYELVYERFTRATESLKDGYVDAVYYTGGIPADGIVRLAGRTDIRLVVVPAEIQQKLVKEYPYFSSESIPAGSYRGQAEPVSSIGLRALLVTTEGLSDHDAERFLQVIYQNSSSIAAQNLVSTFFRREDSLKGVDAEMMHRGALKFFQKPAK